MVYSLLGLFEGADDVDIFGCGGNWNDMIGSCATVIRTARSMRGPRPAVEGLVYALRDGQQA